MTRHMMCATPTAFPATKLMFTRILTSAVFAGAAAGLISALLLLVFVQPVLLHAELYETQELVHFGAEAVSAHPDIGGFDLQRDGQSILFQALIFVGYALVMIAFMSLAEMQGHVITARTGVIWGVAGFVAFHLAPGFSLAPEVPGAAHIDVGERQVWWWATAVAAGLALWLIAFGRSWVMWGAAIALLLAPHLIGAPQAESFAGPVPPELGALYAARALGVGLAGWALLGCFAGFFWHREGANPA